MPELSIIIVNFNTKELTFQCLNSIFSQKWKTSYEVVLVDNGSTDLLEDIIKNK
jgi:GT2 family glycosyltransferase